MTEVNIPPWVRTAVRVDRPDIDIWYKVEEHGALDGVLIWRGQQEHTLSGDVNNAYAVRQTDTGKVFGISERAGLRGLRTVRVGSRVFILPTTVKVLEGGRKMQQFEIHAEHQEPPAEPVRGAGNRGGGAPSDGGPLPSDKVPF
jgi:hypothetical protein